ncbi:MAG: response regulator transcription factor [Dehalococcoidia bacterium]
MATIHPPQAAASRSRLIRPAVQPRVLVLSPSPAKGAAIARYLAGKGFAATPAASAARAQLEARANPFDLLLVDLPQGSGGSPWEWEAIARAAQAPVVLLRSATGRGLGASSASATTVLRRPVAWDTVVRAMVRVLDGDGAPHAARGPSPRASSPPPQAASASDSKPLSPREHEVLRMLVDGLPNKAVAEAMQLSEATVKKHVQRIVAKLHARDRTHASAIAVRTGLVD